MELKQLELRMVKDQLAREREDREQERATARETVDDLRKRLDRSEERVLALSAQPAQAALELPAMVKELHRRLEESEAHIRAMVIPPPAPQAAQERPSEPQAGMVATGGVWGLLGRLLAR